MCIQEGFFIGQFRKHHGWLPSLSIGILAAVLLALFRTEMMNTIGAGQVQAGQSVINEPVSGKYFCYLLFCRGFPFYLLLMITLRTGKRMFFNVYFAYCGFIYGVQAVLLTMQYQLAAIPMLTAQLMPQVLCYGAALYLGYGLVADVYSRSIMRQKAVVCALIWTVGLAAEWYLNPFVIRFCMQYIM